MKVIIKATGYGATALQNGTILHFDVEERKAKKPDKRKLEAEVDIADARRIKELGWGDFKDPGEDEADRAELGEEVHKLEQAPEAEAGKPSQKVPPADRDDPARNARLLADASKPKRSAAARKPVSDPIVEPRDPVPPVTDPAAPVDDGSGTEGSVTPVSDPDAGPAA